jgi:hypothetical protein
VGEQRPLAVARCSRVRTTAATARLSLYTLIETAKMNGIEPEAYLRAVIERIADHPMKQIDELLPWKIAA